jgi:solute carrier family 35, member C2
MSPLQRRVLTCQVLVFNLNHGGKCLCHWKRWLTEQYNKWMFTAEGADQPPSDDDPIDAPPKKHIVFPYPFFTTCVHMLVQFCLASLVLYFIPRFRPSRDSTDPHHPHRRESSRDRDSSKNHGPIMTYWFYFTRIGPCGAATSLDIGLGNMSFKYITLTFYSRSSLIL